MAKQNYQANLARRRRRALKRELESARRFINFQGAIIRDTTREVRRLLEMAAPEQLPEADTLPIVALCAQVRRVACELSLVDEEE